MLKFIINGGKKLKGTIKTKTDLQALLCVLLTQSEGQALVHETIYEGRLAWTEELKRI